MNYIKGYKIFESEDNFPELEEIEELFYPISDDNNFDIDISKRNFRKIKFIKPIMACDPEVNKKFDNIACISHKYIDKHDLCPVIRVVISPAGLLKGEKQMNINSFINELKFPINYITKELGLELNMLWANRGIKYTNDYEYPQNLYYKDLDTLLNDKIMCKGISSLVLYFC
jgi:hypothetical protein